MQGELVGVEGPGRETAQQYDGPLHVSRPRRPRAARERAADQSRMAPPASHSGGDVRDESSGWVGSASPPVRDDTGMTSRYSCA